MYIDIFLCSYCQQDGKLTMERMVDGLKENANLERANWTLDSIQKVAARVKTSKKDSAALLHDILERSMKSTSMLNNITEYPTSYDGLLKELDDLYDEKKKSSVEEGSGLLHGLPLSVKECVSIKGSDSTAGTARRIGSIAEEDAVLIQVLRKQGAVIFARTNVPQTMLRCNVTKNINHIFFEFTRPLLVTSITLRLHMYMILTHMILFSLLIFHLHGTDYCSFECSNPIYGQTCNPYDLKRGPGGSSGGEGSLIGSFGSILGIGSDIGGSLRIPAAFSGCCVSIPPPFLKNVFF
jgi:hypothetical protein